MGLDPEPEIQVRKAPDPGSGSATLVVTMKKKIRRYGPIGLPAATVAGGNVLDTAGVLHSGQDLLTRYTLLIRLLLYTSTALYQCCGCGYDVDDYSKFGSNLSNNPIF